MKRFIRYLYEYEQGRRTRNVGFVKVEQSDDECIVHIHGKGLRMGGHKKLGLYLFYEDDKECIGVWQGEIDNINPSVNYRLRYTQEDTGIPENYLRIEGIIMENDGHRKYAAVWNDMPVDVNHMRVWEPQREPEEVDETPMQQQRPPEEIDETPMQQQDPAQEVPENIVVDEDEQGPLVPQREENSDLLPWKLTKIQRKDLAQLPRCEWRLSNNSFLLHGYYNYRHLVFIQDGRKMRLGVPGIYHEQEAKAAETFGFPEFVSVDQMNISLEPEERNDEEKFGYWCRQVKYFPR